MVRSLPRTEGIGTVQFGGCKGSSEGCN
ncbi:hypothetical protein TELCIR_21689 [Teladorsagia circumcincta]|uniref:Uncharacterized protein n=1 Tax=Teladorsagia circumcincta TaxID=45464 RepID=A0A2G9THT3_TELCI|nr:hypothetical protein TELCIR_21689 [Teladorsagia circumcincta]